MSAPLPPFNRADGLENLIGLIILILWGIGRLTMSRSKPSPQRPAEPSPPPAQPEEELRRFLEELSGEPPAPPPVPAQPPEARPGPRRVASPAVARKERESARPPPVPRPPIPPRPPRSVVPPPPRPREGAAVSAPVGEQRRAPPAEPSVAVPAAAPPPLQVAIFGAVPRAVLPTPSFGGMLTLRGALVRRTGPRAHHVRRLLREPRSRQDAIVLAEVLGPPRALSDH
ncbi:MAG: hypothetical protein N2652_08745 [Kiritimatiellae bacterium]|nr:hypothetical protein [Kiritimatiellia bacterium]